MTQLSFERSLSFDEAFTDGTRGQRRILRRDYRKAGLLPVVDQGINVIAGYTDDEASRFDGRLPVIVFGDHTRVFKYVDFPFAIGADGLKVLVPTNAFEPRYLYYFLLTQEVPARGYSRHFQFLRSLRFRWIPRLEQRRIVEILDQANRLRLLRTEADARADRVVRALFLRTFGDPRTNPLGWPRVSMEQLGRPVSGSVFPRHEQGIPDGEIPVIKVSDMNTEGNESRIRRSNNFVSSATVRRLKLTPAPAGTVVFPKIGAAIATNKKRLLVRTTAYDNNVIGIVPNDDDYSAYLFGFFQLLDLRTLARSTAVPYIRSSDLSRYRLPKPSSTNARQFSVRLSQLFEAQDRRTKSRKLVDGLFQSLMYSAFAGSLTAGWRKRHAAELLRDSLRCPPPADQPRGGERLGDDCGR